MNDYQWNKLPASRIFKIQGGNSFKSSDAQETGIRWLKIANVSFGKILWEDESFLPSNFIEVYRDFLLKEGDIIMSLTRPVLSGRLKISKVQAYDIPSLLNQRVGRLILKGDVDTEFIYQVLLQKRIAYEIEQNLQGTDPPNLSINTFDNIIIPLPPLAEQKAIAETLGLWDKAITKLERLIALKEKRFQWLLHELIGQKIKEAEITENGWKKVKLGDVGQIIMGNL
jgi:type I restriction enzyme S subunit